MSNRRLAAIFAANVVGYSRMLGADEAGTLAALDCLYAAALEPERWPEALHHLALAVGELGAVMGRCPKRRSRPCLPASRRNTRSATKTLDSPGWRRLA